MSANGLPLEGGCRCGQVRFRVSAPPMVTMACHCRGCQQMTASAFSLTAVVPSEGFEVTAGEPVIGGLHGPQAHHFFCPHCMSWLFTRAEGLDWFVNVRSAMLDEPRWTTPFAELYTSEKIAWATTPAVKSFPQFPTFDGFGELVKEYQAQGGAA